MKILAIDPGSKRVGIAVSDPAGFLARPLPFLNALPADGLLAELKALQARESVQRVLVGVPRNMDGSYGPSAQEARLFIEKLKAVLDVPVEAVDERLSTVQAQRQLHESGRNSREQKTLVDSASAAILLQSYLDRPVPLPEDLESE